jgi:alanine racemase
MPVSTWVEVDLDRFASNLRAVRDLLLRERAKAPEGRGPVSEPEILLVLKADAYGHGAVEMAQAAEREGVAHFGVATLHEGIQLRQAGCRLPVVVLSPLLPSEIAEAVAHRLDPTVCDLEFARALSAAAESSGRALRFHVEIDTGMGRIGVRDEEAEAFLTSAIALPA